MYKKTIGIDFDGVLANLDTGLRFFIKDKYNIELEPKSNRDKEFYKYLPEYAKADGFHLQAKMKRANDLIEFISEQNCNIIIITSCGQFYDVSSVAHQKRKWFDYNFREHCNIPFVTTTSGKDKAILAHNNIMLIDDHSKNIDAFIKAGGHGFVYSEDVFEECKEKITEFIEG